MTNEQPQITTIVMPNKKKPAFDIGGFLLKSIYHWPLFIVGLIFCMLCAFYYLKKAQPIYHVKATLVIKDEKRTPNQQSKLAELELVNSSKVIENEIEILKSKRLMDSVTKKLQLWVSYQKKDKILTHDLYKNTPVKIRLTPSTNVGSHEIDIVLKDDRSFYVKNPNGKLDQLYFYKTYNSSWGTWMLEPTDNLKHFKGAGINIVISDPEEISALYQKKLDISVPNKLATMLILSLDDIDAERGKDILNQLILSYKNAAIENKREETKSTLGFIDQRLDSLARQLSKAERGIESYKSSRGITDIASDAKINQDDKQINERRLQDVTVQLSVINGIESYVNSSRGSGAPSISGINDVGLSRLVENLIKLQLEKEKLLATTPETNPDFEQLNRQIITTKSAIKDIVKSLKTSLVNTKIQLQAFDSGFKSTIEAVPTQERQYGNIKRQQASIESLYTYLLQKREEVSVSYNSLLIDDRLVDAAYAGSPVKPFKAFVYGIALILGICIPLTLIYLRTIFSNKIVNINELKDDVEVPVLAELPLDVSGQRIALNNNRITPTTEQFRSLRAKLYNLHSDDEDKGRVILITSSIPGEGKSFVSANLGYTLAISEKKTIVLELDMRKPKIAEIFGLSKEHVGVSDYLNGTANETDIIQNSAIDENLDIISCGTFLKNPTELLEKRALKELITTLKKTYNNIIIDTSPVHIVPEALVLSRVADLTLYIVRQGFTPKSELDFLKQLHQDNELSNINIVFNGVERVKYGYGYNYSKSYYTSKNNSILTAVFSDFTNRF